jgi:hypothetical protein
VQLLNIGLPQQEERPLFVVVAMAATPFPLLANIGNAYTNLDREKEDQEGERQIWWIHGVEQFQ